MLRSLLERHPELIAEAEEIASATVTDVDAHAVAEDVEQAVLDRDLDDLNSRAGRHSWGYVEPTEAAWELLAEAVDPFLDEMKRHVELGFERPRQHAPGSCSVSTDAAARTPIRSSAGPRTSPRRPPVTRWRRWPERAPRSTVAPGGFPARSSIRFRSGPTLSGAHLDERPKRLTGDKVLCELAEMGLATVFWCYLRNPAFKTKEKDYHVSADLSGQANHLGVTLQADIIKQKLPENTGGYNALSTKESPYGKINKRVYSELSTEHPIDLRRHQVANCYMGRAGLISGRKAFQRPRAEGVKLRIGGEALELRPGEALHMGHSGKFSRAGFRSVPQGAGFERKGGKGQCLPALSPLAPHWTNAQMANAW